MDTRFSLHFDSWLTALLRQKAIATETGPAPIGAADLSIMLSDFVLETLAENPRACLNCCGLDDVADRELAGALCFDRDALAAAFIGACVELATWMGEDGVSFLVANGVQEEDAIEFSHAVDVATEKLGARGQWLVTEPAGRGECVGATA